MDTPAKLSQPLLHAPCGSPLFAHGAPLHQCHLAVSHKRLSPTRISLSGTHAGSSSHFPSSARGAWPIPSHALVVSVLILQPLMAPVTRLSVWRVQPASVAL